MSKGKLKDQTAPGVVNTPLPPADERVSALPASRDTNMPRGPPRPSGDESAVYVSKQRAAKLIGRHPKTLDRLNEAGLLNFYQLGPNGNDLVKVEELLALPQITSRRRVSRLRNQRPTEAGAGEITEGNVSTTEASRPNQKSQP